MTLKSKELIRARFIRELKNRFLCEVEIDGNAFECYVPSSCRLTNFLELKNKQVLLRKNASPKTRTQYALVATPYKRSYLLLNSSLANRIIEDNIHKRRFSFLGKRSQIFKEYYIDGYKADLFIADTNTIIEIKSLITTERTAAFPTVYSERAVEQLQALKKLLVKGYRVYYIIVSLNPYVNEITIDPNTKLFELFAQCKEMCFHMKGFGCRLRECGIIIDKEIPLEQVKN